MSNMLNSFIAFYVFLIGLCVGSFLNVAILRGLSGENMVLSRSKCPKCNNQLKWYMNIPLLSYIFLKGKCAFCKEPISIQYPLVEFICAILFLCAYFSFGLSIKTLFVCIFIALFIALCATDIKETVILDYHAYILLLCALLYCFTSYSTVNIIQAVIGALFGFLIFEIMARIGYFIINYRIFGEGDSLIALALGALFGIKNLFIVIALSLIIQCLFAIPFLVKSALQKGTNKLAFSYIFTFLSLILVFVINYFNLIENDTIYLIFALFVSAVLIWSLINILAEIKNKKVNDFDEAKEQFCLLPFGPALVISACICIFFLSQIKAVIFDFIH